MIHRWVDTVVRSHAVAPRVRLAAPGRLVQIPTVSECTGCHQGDARHYGWLVRVLAGQLSVAAGARSGGGHGPWLVATAADTAGIDADVLQHSPGSASVPPLRHHIDDIRELVPFLLLRVNPSAKVLSAPATIQLLLRAKWPGNVGQLRRVLSKVVQRRRSGIVQPEDLPPEVRTMTRRVLTPLESMERDAIVRGLLDAEGNKTHAAQSLGMSRATIYRKIRGYGIDIPG